MFGNNASEGVSPVSVLAALFAGFGGYWLLRYSGVPMGAIIGVLIVAIVAAAFGWVVGRVLSHRIDGDGTFAQFVGWSSLVGWLLPPLGLFLSFMAWELSNAASNRRWLLMSLSTLGGLASLCNAGVGLFFASHAYA